jgi:hypothetical protein
MGQIIVEQYVKIPCISKGHKFPNIKWFPSSMHASPHTEITILANEVGFQDVSEDGSAE